MSEMAEGLKAGAYLLAAIIVTYPVVRLVIGGTERRDRNGGGR